MSQKRSTDPYQSADRTYYPCCQVIGWHASDCPESGVAPPQTWRDLSEALTPQQVAYLENWDANPIPGIGVADGQHEQALLRTAHEFIASNAAAVRFAHIAPPPEDGHHYPWSDEYDGSWSRSFVGTTREVGAGKVVIHGIQTSDGKITRSITADCEDLTPSDAALVAAALIEAAAEVDRLAQGFA